MGRGEVSEWAGQHGKDRHGQARIAQRQTGHIRRASALFASCSGRCWAPFSGWLSGALLCCTISILCCSSTRPSGIHTVPIVAGCSLQVVLGGRDKSIQSSFSQSFQPSLASPGPPANFSSFLPERSGQSTLTHQTASNSPGEPFQPLNKSIGSLPHPITALSLPQIHLTRMSADDFW